MKKVVLILSLAVVFTSCQNNDEISQNFDIQSEEVINSALEEIDVISDAGMETLGISNGRIGDDVLACATVTKDTVSKKVTIDFGTGCADNKGRLRAGKIEITYSGGRWYQVGATRTVTFVDFSIDTIQVEGTRSVTNVATTSGESLAFQTSLSGGKLTFTDGTTATREATHLRKWYRGTTPSDDYAEISGNASGANREGVTYAMEILEPITYKRSCGTVGIFVPVDGIKEISVGENLTVIDYGNGDCDNIATVTINGESSEITLDGKRARRIRRNN